MQPFDEQWIEQLERQYGSKHEWEKTAIYHIATDERWAPDRKLINEFITCYPKETQDKLLSKLGKAENFSNTYHEIVVGNMLSRSGSMPVYEYVLTATSGKPDWYVSPCGSEPGCYVEVLSDNFELTKDEHLIREIGLRASGIPVAAWITVTPRVGDAGDQSEETPKTYIKRIQDWLSKEHWGQGQSKLAGTFEFKLEHLSSDLGHVELMPKSMARFVKPERVKRKIRDKVRKYGKACLDAGCGLLIAVFPEPLFDPDLQDAEAIALGRTTGYGTDAHHACPTILRDRSGLFTPDGPLSGLVWLTPQDGNWSSRILLNEQAHIHPPDAVLRALDTTVSPL